MPRRPPGLQKDRQGGFDQTLEARQNNLNSIDLRYNRSRLKTEQWRLRHFKGEDPPFVCRQDREQPRPEIDRVDAEKSAVCEPSEGNRQAIDVDAAKEGQMLMSKR